MVRHPSMHRAATNITQRGEASEGVPMDSVRLVSRLLPQTAVTSLSVTRAILKGVQDAATRGGMFAGGELGYRGPARRAATAAAVVHRTETEGSRSPDMGESSMAQAGDTR